MKYIVYNTIRTLIIFYDIFLFFKDKHELNK